VVFGGFLVVGGLVRVLIFGWWGWVLAGLCLVGFVFFGFSVGGGLEGGVGRAGARGGSFLFFVFFWWGGGCVGVVVSGGGGVDAGVLVPVLIF